MGYRKKLGIRLRGYGIKTAYDYVQKEDEWIKKRFGKNGLFIKYELLGTMISPISNETDLPKSISDSKSFPDFTSDINFLRNELSIHIHSCCKKLRNINCKCSSIGVFIKTKEFKTYYEKINTEIPMDFEFDISKTAFCLLDKLYKNNELYRSIGIVLEDFCTTQKEQLLLFENDEKREKNQKLGKALDLLEKKFGRNIIRTGFVNKEVPYKQDFLTLS